MRSEETLATKPAGKATRGSVNLIRSDGQLGRKVRSHDALDNCEPRNRICTEIVAEVRSVQNRQYTGSANGNRTG